MFVQCHCDLKSIRALIARRCFFCERMKHCWNSSFDDRNDCDLCDDIGTQTYVSSVYTYHITLPYPEATKRQPCSLSNALLPIIVFSFSLCLIVDCSFSTKWETADGSIVSMIYMAMIFEKWKERKTNLCFFSLLWSLVIAFANYFLEKKGLVTCFHIGHIRTLQRLLL